MSLGPRPGDDRREVICGDCLRPGPAAGGRLLAAGRWAALCPTCTDAIHAITRGGA